MITIPNVKPTELTELLNSLAASGHGSFETDPQKSGTGKFEAHNFWAKVRGTYTLNFETGALDIACDGHEKQIGQQLTERLASIRGVK